MGLIGVLKELKLFMMVGRVPLTSDWHIGLQKQPFYPEWTYSKMPFVLRCQSQTVRLIPRLIKIKVPFVRVPSAAATIGL